MQSTGHSSTHALSLTSIQGLAITYGMPSSPRRRTGCSRGGSRRVDRRRLGLGVRHRLGQLLDEKRPDLEALELAGRGLRELVGEQDLAGRLEVGEPVAAPGD